ncbi:unnamed protein product [Fusarium graminearum]|uniref:Uncharacterized protein n=1 Tax=Gibberella zeae TaxID=5518 RepID=A0A4E9DUL8_GIBZA|nr:unnamed protein product [Fusarium graminearum]CAG1991925.1 unnamed protein product [Fusarium graminearum]CAG1999652.1 unnamed protein product [Fusarium graminearum]
MFPSQDLYCRGECGRTYEFVHTGLQHQQGNQGLSLVERHIRAILRKADPRSEAWQKLETPRQEER